MNSYKMMKGAFLGAAVGVVLALTIGCAPPVLPAPAPEETTGDGDGDNYPCNIPGTPPCPDIGDPAGDGDGDGGECFEGLASHLCCIEGDPCLWSCVETLLNDPCPEGHVVIGAAP